MEIMLYYNITAVQNDRIPKLTEPPPTKITKTVHPKLLPPTPAERLQPRNPRKKQKAGNSKGGNLCCRPQIKQPFGVRASRTAARHIPSSPDGPRTPSGNPDGDCDNRCSRSAPRHR